MRKESRTYNSLASNTAIYIIKTFLTLSFPVLTFAYASRILLEDGIGKVSFAESIISFCVFFASLGIDNYGVREASKLRNDREKLSKFVKEIFAINVITTIITYVVLLALLNTIDSFVNYREVIVIYSLLIGFKTLGMEWLYNALEKYVYITIRVLFVQIISYILLFLLVKQHDDIYVYALIMVFSTVGANLANLLNVPALIDINKKSKLEVRKHLPPILIFFATAISGHIYLNLDTAMLGVLSDESAVGLYTAAVKANRLIVSLISAVITGVLLPRLVFMISTKRKDEYNKILGVAFRIILTVAFFFGILMFFLCGDIITILCGEQFGAANITAQIMTLIIIFISVSTLINNLIFIPNNKEKYQLIISAFGAISNIVLNFLFIPRYQQNGAALGTVITEGIVMIMEIYFANKIVEIRPLFKILYKIAISGVVTIGVCVGLNQLGLVSWAKCFVYAFISFIVYGLVWLYLERKKLREYTSVI